MKDKNCEKGGDKEANCWIKALGQNQFYKMINKERRRR
jgi:hypothetical protein